MKNRKPKPYARRHRLGYIDGRTYEAKIAKQFRAELYAHLGGAEPTLMQREIVDRAVWIKVRLAMLDGKVTTDNWTDYDSKAYLAWSHSLARMLARLGIEPDDDSTAQDDPLAALRAHYESEEPEEAA